MVQMTDMNFIIMRVGKNMKTKQRIMEQVSPPTFNDLKFNPTRLSNGVQALVYFSNNYGASVVKHDFSYGNKKGLYEIAVLVKKNLSCNNDKGNWIISYHTPITNDVIGSATEQEITKVLQQIAHLPIYNGVKNEKN